MEQVVQTETLNGYVSPQFETIMGNRLFTIARGAVAWNNNCKTLRTFKSL